MKRQLSYLAAVASLLVVPSAEAGPRTRPIEVAPPSEALDVSMEFSFAESHTIVLDGVEVAPEVLADSEEPLIYLIDRNSIAEGAVYVFSSPWTFSEYLQVAHGERLVYLPTPVGFQPAFMPLVTDPCLEDPECGGGGGGGGSGDGGDWSEDEDCSLGVAWFYEHVDYGGVSKSILAEEPAAEEEYGGEWFNDEISSVKSAGSYTKLYEHKDFGGDQLVIQGCIAVRSLHSSNNALGYDPNFGDKTTSIRVFPW